MKKKDKGYFSIRDISKIAGVSTATVSRVINTPEMTSEATRKKVMKVIEEYNYVPNQMAKNLFAMTSNSIAIFIYDMENPFFIALIKELNNIAFKNKYNLLICDTENNATKEREYYRYCQSIRTKGIIMTEGIRYDDFLLDDGPPITVFLDRTGDNIHPSVTSDNYKGVKLLMDYLYALNHRKIGFAGSMDQFQSAIIRKKSYIDALKYYDLEVKDEYIFSGGFNYKTGVRAFDYYSSLDDKPTAIVCANDQIAKGLIMKANKSNISVPNDFSVVGFDGVDPAYFYPKITTVKQNIKKIAKKLFDAATGKTHFTGEEIVDISLLIGESCRRIDLV
ncbi:MAG: LacI family transcriptional regulator [Tissierellia bacterium]|nr:LacI family transcriptional regulator [Tissierellia bacterium]